MKFYFFTKGDNNVPSSRYRAYCIADELNARGQEAFVIPTYERGFTNFLRYLKILLKIKSSDVIYLQRTIYNRYFSWALVIAYIFGKRFVFDIDDAVYEHSPKKTILLVKYAKYVTCGSTKILEWVTMYNKKASILTNSIPLHIYTQRISEPNTKLTIGWIGSKPEIFMEPAVKALSKLAQSRDFNLRVIGAMGNRSISEMLRGVPNLTIIDSLNWSDPSEAVAEIKKFHIGIMPLRKDEWDQVKYFKALEYMACGVPVVASAADTISRILKTDNCGLVANNDEEWVASLTELLDNPDLRKKFAINARKIIEEKYSMKAITKEFIDVVAR